MVGESKRQQRTDTKFAAGPIEHRKCTDLFWCILFLLFCIGTFVIAGVAFKNGDPYRLASVYDSDGQQCGYDEGYENYPFIYFPNPSAFTLNQTVCVAHCPTGNETEVNCKPNRIFLNCSKEMQLNENFKVYNSHVFAGRICVPSNIKNWRIVEKGITLGSIEQSFRDLLTSWEILIGSAFIAILIGFSYMLLIRHCAGVITCLLIIGTLAFLVLLGVFFYNISHVEDTEVKENTDDYELQKIAINNHYFKYLAFAMWILAGLIVLFIVLFWNKIRLSIGIIQASAEFVIEVPSTLLVSPLFAILTMGYIAFWILVLLYLWSSGTVGPNPNGYPFVSMKLNDNISKYFYYHIFGLFWSNAILVAIPHFIISVAAAIWYFSLGDNPPEKNPVLIGILYTTRYHFGSLALGSLLISTLRIINLIFESIQTKVDELERRDSLQCVVKSCSYCLICFEKFMRYIKKNAFIRMAVSGENFFTSSKESFFLIIRNPGRFAFLEGIGELSELLGQLFITVVSTFLGYWALTHTEYYNQRISSPFVPTIFFGIISWVVASSFMSVYGTASDTMVQLFCMDEEIQSGLGASSAIHAPPKLRAFIERETTEHLNRRF